MQTFVSQVFAGLSVGSILLLIALGLVLTFGQMGVINMAQGEFIMAGAYTAYLMQFVTGSVELFGVNLPISRIFILALSLAAVAALTMVLTMTSLGGRIRATVQNRQLAETSGISTRRTDRTTFFIGSGLAGIAGVALSQIGSIGPTLGTNYVIDAFLVVVVGGIGQIKGAVIAAFALGLLRSGFEFWTSASIAKVLVFVAIAIFLQIRPQGIVNVRSRSLA